jgi:hypothetical protein
MTLQQTSECVRLFAQLDQALRSGQVELLSDQFYAHVSECAACRAAMRFLAVGSVDLPEAWASIECEHCRRDLEQFIVIERDHPGEAARSYPQVWWHLWHCADCAAAADRMVAADPDAELVSLRHIHLERTLLAMVLPTPASPASTVRGFGPRSFIVYYDDDEYMITVEVVTRDQYAWDLKVTLEPPADALLVMTCGPAQSMARFDPNGVALVNGIPSETDTAGAEPDIAINVLVPYHQRFLPKNK